MHSFLSAPLLGLLVVGVVSGLIVDDVVPLPLGSVLLAFPPEAGVVGPWVLLLYLLVGGQVLGPQVGGVGVPLGCLSAPP